MSKKSMAGCLPLVPCLDTHQIIGFPEVQLGEDGGLWVGLKEEMIRGKGYLIFTMITFRPW